MKGGAMWRYDTSLGGMIAAFLLSRYRPPTWEELWQAE